MAYLLHTQGINQRHLYYNTQSCICYCTVATYSYIHAIHSHAIGCSHNIKGIGSRYKQAVCH